MLVLFRQMLHAIWRFRRDNHRSVRMSTTNINYLGVLRRLPAVRQHPDAAPSFSGYALPGNSDARDKSRGINISTLPMTSSLANFTSAKIIAFIIFVECYRAHHICSERGKISATARLNKRYLSWHLKLAPHKFSCSFCLRRPYEASSADDWALIFRMTVNMAGTEWRTIIYAVLQQQCRNAGPNQPNATCSAP